MCSIIQQFHYTKLIIIYAYHYIYIYIFIIKSIICIICVTFSFVGPVQYINTVDIQLIRVRI